RSLLFLQGDQQRVLGPDGFTVEKEVKFPKRYRFNAERKDVWIGLASGPRSLDVIDKKTLRIRKSVDLPFHELTDFAMHPRLRLSFVAVRHALRAPRYKIVIVNETLGTLSEPNSFLGKWVRIDPTGDWLYAGVEELYRSGTRFHINPGFRIITSPKYGSIELLLKYRLRGAEPKLEGMVQESGGNGSRIELSPDGKRVTYLSHVGFPRHSGGVPAWNADNLEEKPVRYPCKELGASATTATYHHLLKLIAVPTKNSAVLFDRETGKHLPGKLLLTSRGVGDVAVQDVRFSPDGRNLILLTHAPLQGKFLQAVPLRLTDQERQTVGGGFQPPSPPKPQPRPSVPGGVDL
ncbi:MAG: hypothetical protein N2C14_04595, partial [Planctomycetales bacterium]